MDQRPKTETRPKIAALTVTGLGLFAFLVLKAYSVHPHRSDEGIYFYLALRTAEGARLYRDLFFAHPPLHLLLPALLTALFGYSFELLKALPSLAGAAQGVLVFFIARRAFKSELAGSAAALALWFSEDFLKSSSYLTGINQAGALWCGALLLVLHRRWAWAGALAGLAAMTLLQTAALGVGLGAVALLEGRRPALRFAAAFAGVVAAVHLWGLAVGGSGFFEQVYLYHLNKVGAGGGKMLTLVIADNLTLWVSGGVALALFFREKDEEARRFLVVLGALALVHVSAMVTRPTVYPFYFQPVLVLLALGFGWALSRCVEMKQRLAGAGLAAAVVLGPTLLHGPLVSVLSPTRAEQLKTYSQSYRWHDAPFLGPLNGAVRALCWRDRREAGDSPLPPTEYLWNQSRGFDAYPRIVTEVSARTAPGDTVFGDSTSLPLVALGAGRRIALDFADTNVQRFLSGTTDPSAVVARLEAAPPKLVLVSEERGAGGLEAVRAWLGEHYAAVGSFSDEDGDRYTLFQRR